MNDNCRVTKTSCFFVKGCCKEGDCIRVQCPFKLLERQNADIRSPVHVEEIDISRVFDSIRPVIDLFSMLSLFVL